MKKLPIYLLIICALFIHTSIAAVNPITVTFSTGTTSFAVNGSGTANYIISVNAGVVPPNVPLTFSFKPTASAGLTATQVSTSSLCPGVSTVCSNQSFSLSAGQSCCLEFSLTGSNAGSYSLQPLVSTTPVAAFSGQASALPITVSSATSNTPLTITSTLALSVDCPSAGGSCVYSNAALTGHAREITIQNASTTNTTTPLTVTPASLPSDTNITDGCTGATLGPLDTCTVTITPGQMASSSCTSGSPPSPGTITVNASSAPSPAVSDIYVLSYGCIYQGGFVYSIDDTTNAVQPRTACTLSNMPCQGSIGGKVAAESDQALPYIYSGPQSTSIIWSSNGASVDVSYDIIPLIAETSTGNDSYATAQTTFNGTYFNTNTYPFPSSSAFQSCSGGTDGACNSANILALYDTTYNGIDYITTNYGTNYTLSAGKTTLTYYAAGLCSVTNSGGYNTGWYLPAICEMGPASNGSGCASGGQNMLNALPFLIGDPTQGTPGTSCSYGSNCLAGYYWSSTEGSGEPQSFAWSQYFASGGGSDQNHPSKIFPLGVRCSRGFE